MNDPIFDERNLIEIRSRGIAHDEILRQIQIFKKGSPCINLLRPCRTGDGIKRLEDKDIARLNKVYEIARSSGRAMKFVPASGAATRMFRELTSISDYLDKTDTGSLAARCANGDYKYLSTFIENLNRFPFYNDLKSAMSRDGIDIEKAVSEGGYKIVLEYALSEKGLNLAGLPKCLIPFHRYPGYSRTPVEEHLVEAGVYTVDGAGKARIHFTVSIEHEDAIRNHVDKVKGHYENPGLHYEINFSNQKPSTDTIAVDMENKPFKGPDGSLLFRPGGHGALLENLNDLNGDIIFIKNIDNVAPDGLKEASYAYKKALGGYLVELQDRIFGYLERLERGEADEDFLAGIFGFIRDDLSISPPEGIGYPGRDKKIEFLVHILNRPLRICGMVRNEAEPGGGPFWVGHADGGVSLQIVEKSQVNLSDEAQRRIFESSTHFNPVDLICGVRDYRGRNFDLRKYVDPETCFISIKSKDGIELKALELPGLWNGAMAWWNTVFIEVPLITFNPVKTIFDLLRDEHQPEVIIE